MKFSVVIYALSAAVVAGNAAAAKVSDVSPMIAS
jgi:hypothetical protein